MDGFEFDAPEERMTWEEIGQKLGISAHEAEVAFDRGMAKLRNKLPQHLIQQGLRLLSIGNDDEDTRYRTEGHAVHFPGRAA